MSDLFTLYRLSQRRIPALIALMAILMLFIAPEVSKTLEHRRMQSDSGAVSGSSSDMMDGMSMMAMDHNMQHSMTTASPDDIQGHTEQHLPEYPPHMMSSEMGTMDDFACGYCQLLAHFPVLAWILIPVISLLLLRSRTSPSLLSPATPVTFFPGISQPRAPPAL